MTVQRLKLAGVAIGCFAFLAAPGVAFAASKCTSKEVKATGKKASCKAAVFAKAAAKGLPADSAKLTACETKFSTAFTKAMGANDCNPGGASESTIESKVDAFVNDLSSESAGGPLPSKCQAAKLTAAGKKASCVLGVDAKGIAKDLPPDPAKRAACGTKMSASFTKAETKTDCGAAPGDSTIETKVDNFEADVLSEENPPLASTTTTTSASTTTTMGGVCCGINPTRLNFTTGIGSGNCGTLKTGTGSLLENLQCGGLYTGGGSSGVPLPFKVPDMGSSLTAVACVGSGPSLTLSQLTSTQTGSKRNCTATGCLFGPPLPIPNTATTPISLCVINTVAQNAIGTANCSTGASSLSLPLSSELFLTGDLFATADGIQSCPVCNQTCTGGSNAAGPCNSNADCPSGGTCGGPVVCHGGLNNGMACTPADSPVDSSFPTTHDCPPSTGLSIGSLPIAFALSTGTVTKTGQTLTGPVTAMARVYCGFCRDIDAAGTGCFEGDPRAAPQCPGNSGCLSAGSPYPCCTGANAGSCSGSSPKACTASSDCTDGSGTWPNCQQHNPGAFGFGTARTITENGAPSGSLTDGAAHASTLVSIFCIPPTLPPPPATPVALP